MSLKNTICWKMLQSSKWTSIYITILIKSVRPCSSAHRCERVDFCPLGVNWVNFWSIKILLFNHYSTILRFWFLVHFGCKKTSLPIDTYSQPKMINPFASVWHIMGFLWAKIMHLKNAGMLFFKYCAKRYRLALSNELLFIIIAQVAAKLWPVKVRGPK